VLPAPGDKSYWRFLKKSAELRYVQKICQVVDIFANGGAGAHPAQGDFSKDLNRIYIFGKSTMSEFMHEHSTRVKDQDGTTYIVRVYAQERTDGTWAGWIEFHPIDERKPVLRTGQETSQPNRAAIEYWTLGLEPVYFDGAFARAQGRLP
jgi:hypothetical protein